MDLDEHDDNTIDKRKGRERGPVPRSEFKQPSSSD